LVRFYGQKVCSIKFDRKSDRKYDDISYITVDSMD